MSPPPWRVKARPGRGRNASLSRWDFLLRLAFFSAAPFGIVAAAELFPVRGALTDVGLALLVLVVSEAAREWASRSRVLAVLLKQALAFEAYYRKRPPRRFVYYVFYPVLFPYWLTNRDARHEFLVFRGYTLSGFVVLVVSLVIQYFQWWAPELGIRAYLPAVGLTLAVETWLVLSLLMPIATTVVWHHSKKQRGPLLALLLVGLASTAVVLAQVARRRDPVVSYMTRERVRLRKSADPRKAHRAMVNAARAAWRELVKLRGIDGDGKVEGLPLAVAQDSLETFFKHDEAHAFVVWAAPRRHPRILVLYFEARPHKPPIYVAIGGDGAELKKATDLPRGAFTAMRKAADGTDPVLPVWPEGMDLPDSG
jgi:hypothetical protein